MEQLVLVDPTGLFCRVKPKKHVNNDDIAAVELVLMYLPIQKQVVLFNRGVGASDMQNHWALESGKVQFEDLTKEDKIGYQLSDQAFINAAIRELKEELNFSVSASKLQKVDQFYMPYKKIFFTLLALPINIQAVALLKPNQSEIDCVRKFSLDEFLQNEYLGDAICYRKDQIVNFLRQQFLGEYDG